MACNIKYHNPVSGERHSSLVAYLLSNHGFEDTTVIEEFLQTQKFILVDGKRQWGPNIPTLSPYQEENILLHPLIQNQSLKESFKEYLKDVQDFYDEMGIHVYQDLTFKQASDLAALAKDRKFTAKVERVIDESGVIHYQFFPEKVSEFAEKKLKQDLAYYQLQDNTLVRPGESLGVLNKLIDASDPTLANVVANILESSEVSEDKKEILKRLLPIARLNDNLDISFVVGNEIDLVNKTTKTYKGKYNYTTNTIEISIGEILDMSPEEFTQFFIHELVHSISFSTLENPQTAAEKKFVKEFREIVKHYHELHEEKVAALLKEDKKLRAYYGFANMHEFFSEFMVNKEFRALLEKDDRKWYQRLLDNLSGFLNYLLRKSNRTQNFSEERLDRLTSDLLQNILSKESLNLSFVGREQFDLQLYLGFSAKDLNAMDQALEGNSEFLNQLNNYLDNNLINWSKIDQEGSRLGISDQRLDKVEDLYKNIDRTEAVLAFKSLTSYLHETAKFLKSVKGGLDYMSTDPTVTLDAQFKKAYHARELGNYFSQVIDELENNFLTNTGTTFGTNTILGAQIQNIKSYVNSLQEDYFRKAVHAVSEKLAETIAPQTAKLIEQTNKEIERIERELQTAGPRVIPMLKKRLQEQKLNKRKFATKENLVNAFTKELKDINTASYYLEAASMSNNLIIGSVGNFINNLFNEANIEAMQFEVQMKTFASQFEAYQRAKGTNATTSLTYDEYFKNLHRKVEILEIQNGELVAVPTIVINSEMDEITYMNEKTQMKYDILVEEKKPLAEKDDAKIERMKKDIREMEEQYEIRPFVSEWYAIQSRLSEEAKEAREEKLEVLRQLQTNSFDENLTEEELDLLEEAKFELERLESDYDNSGNLKEEQGLRIAKNIREWKQDKNAAELYTFEVSEENKELFDHHYNTNESNYVLAVKKYDQAVAKGDSDEIIIASKKLKEQRRVYDLWKRANTVRTISPEWYKERRATIDQISAIQQKYQGEPGERTVSDAFDELFALLKGYKDQDGFYNGEKIYEDTQGSLVEKIKDLQDEIDSLKDTSDEYERGDSNRLKELYAELNDIQQTVKTPYYEKVYNNRLTEQRQILIKEYAVKNESIPSSSTLDVYAARALKKTDWFQQNHRQVTKYVGNRYVLVDEPLFFWVKKEPVDESYITNQSPSFRWTNLKINEKYVNPERKEFFKVKRVALDPTKTKYRNPAWNSLDTTEKQIVSGITEAYTNLQRTIPRNLRKGLELPGVQKSLLESAKVGNIGSTINTTASNVYDSLSFRYGDELSENEDAEGSIANKYNRRLFLKYSNRIGQDKMSVNIFNTITQFGGEMIKFRKGFEQMAYIYGIQDVLEKNKEGTKMKKAIDNLIEARLQGKTRKALGNNKVLNFIEGTIDASLSVGAKSALSFRLPSILKNQFAGTANIMFQLKGYGLDQKDLHKAGFKNMKEYMNLFNAHIEDGKDTPYILKMKYFNVFPDDHIGNTGRRLFRSDLAKMVEKYNPLKHLSFIRTFGEFEMRSAVAEALATKKYSQIRLTSGKVINILEAYESINGVLTIRADIEDQEGLKALENAYRGELTAINNLIHGVYAEMDKAEYSRYTIGRILFFMKGGWLYQQTARRFGGKSVLHGGGIQYEGFYRTLLRGLKDIIILKGDFKYVLNNLMTAQEKADFLTGVFETITTAVTIGLLAALNSLRYSDDDEEDKWALYQLLYTLTLLEDELSTLNPVTGSASIIYSRFINNVDGKDAATYYASKEVALPFKGMYDLLSLTLGMTFGNLVDAAFDTNLGFNPFNEYVPRSSSGKVLNPKRYPQDPSLTGASEFRARIQRLIGMDATVNSVLNPEYIFRKYENRNPRWYLSTLDEDTKGFKKEINSSKKQIKAMERQLDYIEDADTKVYYQEEIARMKDRMKEAAAQKNDLNEEYFRSGLK